MYIEFKMRITTKEMKSQRYVTKLIIVMFLSTSLIRDRFSLSSYSYRNSMGVTIKDNKRDDRNRKVTLNLFVLCFCYILCTLPHVIYSYFDHNNNDLYDFLLGFYWLQYGFNIALYVSQSAQYWNAYKLYIREKIIPRCKKSTMEPSEPPTYVKTPTSRNYVFFNF